MKDYDKQRLDERWKKRSEEIMKRDNYTCQLCGMKYNMVYVYPLKELRGVDYYDYSDEFLITLCPICYSRANKDYKKILKNNTSKRKVATIASLENSFIYFRNILSELHERIATKIISSYIINIALSKIISDYKTDTYNKLHDLFFK